MNPDTKLLELELAYQYFCETLLNEIAQTETLSVAKIASRLAEKSDEFYGAEYFYAASILQRLAEFASRRQNSVQLLETVAKMSHPSEP